VTFYFGGGCVFRDKLSEVLVPSPRLALSLRVANLTISRDELLLHRGNPYELTDTGQNSGEYWFWLFQGLQQSLVKCEAE
jgi:hypothetical protein